MENVIPLIRDILLIIYLVLGIVIALVVLVIVIAIFKKVGPILGSVQSTVNNVQTTTVMFSELAVKPLIRVSSFFTGVRQGLKAVRWVKGRRNTRR